MAEAAGDVFGPINAETGDVTQLTGVLVDAGCTVTATEGSKNNGSYGYDCFVESGDNDCSGYLNFTTQTDMYVRCYIKIPSGGSYAGDNAYWDIQISDGSTIIFLVPLYWNSGSSSFGYLLRMRADDAALKSIIDKKTTAVFALDTWYCIEMHCVIGDVGVGGVQLWINEASEGSNFATYANTNYDCNRIYFGNHGHSAPTGDSHAYYDDIKGDTSYIGLYPAEGGTIVPQVMNYDRRLRA